MTMVVWAIHRLEAAGHKVTPADGVPGLFNVAGIADDVTIGQLCQIAETHGAIILGPSTYNPATPA